MNLYIDTETTGLIQRGHSWDKDYKQFPRMLSIAWQLGDNPPKEYFIHQEGREVPPESTSIHGITTQAANDPTRTHKSKDVLTWFVMDALEASKIIGHNTYFDTSVIKAETLNVFGEQSQEVTAMTQALHKDKRVDLIRIFQKKKEISGGKWLTLFELHKRLFGEWFNSHNALDDIKAVRRCYELINPKHNG